MKLVLSIIFTAAFLAGCTSAPNQRIETIHVLAEVEGFRSSGTVVVLNQNYRHENETKLFFDCLDVSILQPEVYRGRKVTIFLPFAGGPYTEIKTHGVQVSVSVNKRALSGNEPDWTVYHLEDLKIEKRANQAPVPTATTVTPAAAAAHLSSEVIRR